MNQHRKAAQIAQCCRGCPCKAAADCAGGAESEKVAAYIKETAQCCQCGEHDGLVLVVKVATNESYAICDRCVCFINTGKYRLA